MINLILYASMAFQPVAFEIDCRDLPAANTGPGYTFKLTVGVIGEEPTSVPFTASNLAGPGDVSDGIATALGDAKWKVTIKSDVVTVHSYNNLPLLGVSVIGDGPKPDVRRVLVLPPAKK